MQQFHSAKLTCFVLLVLEFTKLFPKSGLSGSRLTNIYVVDLDVKEDICCLDLLWPEVAGS